LSVDVRTRPSSPAAASKPLDDETDRRDDEVGGSELGFHLMGSWSLTSPARDLKPRDCQAVSIALSCICEPTLVVMSGSSGPEATCASAPGTVAISSKLGRHRIYTPAMRVARCEMMLPSHRLPSQCLRMGFGAS
jgi:hypothetical protein